MPVVVANHPDNFAHLQVVVLCRTSGEVFTQRLSRAAEVALRKYLVDDRDTRRAILIALVEIASLDQRHFHVRKVTWTSKDRIKMKTLAGSRFVTFDFDAATRAAGEAA